MEQKRITEEILENGVVLSLYDASRKLAGDRWLVALVALARVPVGPQAPLAGADGAADDLTAIREALGDQIVFEQKRERYFIDEQQKETIFDQMLESFRSMTRNYVAHPQFPSRFVKKSYREFLRRKRLNEQMNNRN